MKPQGRKLELTPEPMQLTEYGRRMLGKQRETMLAELRQCEGDYASGERESLVVAILLSGRLGVPLPLWVVTAWSKACEDYNKGRIEHWDQALIGKRRTAARRRKEHQEVLRSLMLKDVLPFVASVPIRREGDRKYYEEPDRHSYIARHLNSTRRQARKLYDKLSATDRPPRLPKRSKKREK